MISQESIDFWEEGRKGLQFGAPGNEFDLEGLRECMAARMEPASKDVECMRSRIGDIPCEWVVAPGADPDLRILYLHGGGYVSGSGAKYLPFAADLSAASQCAVLLVDYRLAPEDPFPAGLEDCISAHEWMLKSGPYGPAPAKASFIVGDSAGGGLTLATLLALRDRCLALPLGGVPMSAFTDMTLASESIQSQAEKELYMHPSCLPDFVNLYADGADLRDPLISPIFGDYTGIPPLLIQVGDYEVIRDDSVRVAAKAEADGVDVTLEVWPGQVHVFQIRELPESREAIKHIADFIRLCLGQ
ncbi:MAG: alpha/beta hydrolase [Lentisphaeria bacterium]|nr:alpha/beta hydrolase [Lentisphaeria bacterium]NQZ69621.1 alpha/beta hydrolase [Lentisphaeria bacterium]